MQAKLKKISLIASMGVLAATSQFAHAAGTGQITFNGKLIADTCTINAGDAAKTVTLPTVSAKSLAASGNTAGSTMFTLSVTNCPATLSNVAAHFETDNMDQATHAAKNQATTTPATNVVVQLLDKDGTTAIGLGSAGSYVAINGIGDARGATMNYGGRYLATGAAEAGNVMAVVRYTLAYN